MAITKVWLDETTQECTVCGLCQMVCPKVFIISEKMMVRDDADLGAEQEIREAALSCPVSVIALEEDHSEKRDNEKSAGNG